MRMVDIGEELQIILYCKKDMFSLSVDAQGWSLLHKACACGLKSVRTEQISQEPYAGDATGKFLLAATSGVSCTMGKIR